jgi:hypothetical protein
MAADPPEDADHPPLPKGLATVRTETAPPSADPMLLALARYVQALDARYPGGPEQMRDEGLADGANMPTMLDGDDTAA